MRGQHSSEFPAQGVCPAGSREDAARAGHIKDCAVKFLLFPKNSESRRSPGSSAAGLSRHSHPGKSKVLFKRSFLKSHVVVCANYYGEKSLSLNLFVINETMYGLKGWWLPRAFLGVVK